MQNTIWKIDEQVLDFLILHGSCMFLLETSINRYWKAKKKQQKKPHLPSLSS